MQPQEPEDNQPGHHPDEEQDKPDLDEFAARFGTVPPEDRVEEPHDAEGEEDTVPPDSGPSTEETAGLHGPDLPSLARAAWHVTETAVVTGATVAVKVATPVVGAAKGAAKGVFDTVTRRASS